MPKKRSITRAFQMVLILLIILCFSFSNLSSKELIFNIFSRNNGAGLEVDRQIMAEMLESLGHHVNYLEILDSKAQGIPADINIHFEHLTPSHFHTATINWFIPNPEWIKYAEDVLSKVDCILCRTKEVERIFNKLKKKTAYIGFTSVDCYDPLIKKDFSKFLHLAGKSGQKGTGVIFDLWKMHPDLPHLTVLKRPAKELKLFSLSNLLWIDNRIELSDRKNLQNSCGIHLAPSQTEGFGHSISEAMSTGAVVITTNAPPMNEFIVDSKCLIPYSRVSLQELATKYHVDVADLQKVIKKITKMPKEELEKIGKKNRLNYLKRKEEFKARLTQLIRETEENL